MTDDKTTAPEERAAKADLLYGVPAIARYMDMREPQARHLCERGDIPTFRIGRIICSRRSAIDACLAEHQAQALTP
jgi:hypothetical protein